MTTDKSPNVYPNPDNDVFLYGEQHRGHSPGLSLQDYFAAVALSGIAAERNYTAAAMGAYAYADAMLKARK